MISRRRFQLQRQKGLERGFTLIELLAASIIGAMILVAIFALFSNAVRVRDQSTLRAHEAQLRQRAALLIRNDLQSAYISGGVLASSLQGSEQGNQSRFPGYLKFTTTTARDGDDELLGDVQAVSYYIVDDPDSSSHDVGMLVRATNRNIMARVQEDPHEEQLLTAVKSLEVSFFDGSSWITTWNFAPGSTTLPEAVRVRITQAPVTAKSPQQPPLEVLVPWTSQPLKTGTNSVTGSDLAAATPTPTPASASSSDDEEDVVPMQQEGEIPGELDASGQPVMVGDEGDSTDDSQAQPTQ